MSLSAGEQEPVQVAVDLNVKLGLIRLSLLVGGEPFEPIDGNPEVKERASFVGVRNEERQARTASSACCRLA
mgnify:FL=1